MTAEMLLGTGGTYSLPFFDANSRAEVGGIDLVGDMVWDQGNARDHPWAFNPLAVPAGIRRSMPQVQIDVGRRWGMHMLELLYGHDPERWSAHFNQLVPTERWRVSWWAMLRSIFGQIDSQRLERAAGLQ